MQVGTDKTAESALEILRSLLKIDTSHPAGKTKDLINLAANLLKQNGISYELIGQNPDKPNLYAQIGPKSGKGGLLLSSHVDVVPAGNLSTWTQPPFAAELADGMLWGRGAIDMKYKTALDLVLFQWAAKQKLSKPLELLIVSDEEIGSLGCREVLAAKRGKLAAEYVINEVGGMNIEIMGRQFLLLQAGEKGRCSLRLEVRGHSMHASTPPDTSTLGILAAAVSALESARFGVRISAVVDSFFKSITGAAPNLQILAQLTDPVLKAQLSAMLRTTCCPTRIGGGDSLNVIPSSAWAEFDCRFVPGNTEAQLKSDFENVISAALGKNAADCELKISGFEPGYEIDPKDAVFKKIADGLSREWGSKLGSAPVVPMLLPASSDSTSYAGAGLKPIGFAPILFPPGFNGLALTHAVDERIPVEGFKEGVKAYLTILGDYLTQ